MFIQAVMEGLRVSAFETVYDDNVLVDGILDIGERLRGKALKALYLHMVAHQYRADAPVRRVLSDREMESDIAVGDA